MAVHIISSGISELRDARAAAQKVLRPTSSYTNPSAIHHKIYGLTSPPSTSLRPRPPNSARTGGTITPFTRMIGLMN